MIRAVIIDFDDTLCLTEAATFELENEVLARMGRQPQTREIHKATWGKPLFEAIALRSPGVDIPRFQKLLIQAQAEWVKLGRIDGIPLENLKALDAILDADKELFVLTSRTHGEIVHLLKPDHRLASRVKAFYYRDIMPYHKPDPRAFDRLLKENDLIPEECVYVGDALSDATAAKGAHLHFVACLEAGIRTQKDFSPHAVDVFTERFTDVPAAIKQIDKRLQ